METKELRKQITRELKEIGMKRQDYSLKIRESGYGDTYINCKIKNPHINIVKVENILRKYDKIDRYIDGSILRGCNTFVNVTYEYGCFDEVSKQYKELAIQKIEEAKKITDNSAIRVFETNRWICWLFNRNGIVAHVNDLGQIKINSWKELAILIFRMNEFQEDFL